MEKHSKEQIKSLLNGFSKEELVEMMSERLSVDRLHQIREEMKNFELQQMINISIHGKKNKYMRKNSYSADYEQRAKG